MWLRRMDPAPQRLLAAAAWFAFAFWAYYAFLRQVAGPLNPDEIYFSHTLWLLRSALRFFRSIV